MRTIAALLLLLPSWALCSESFSTKDYSLNGFKQTLYVGHYGETLEYSEFWTLRAPKLEDGVEIIRFSLNPNKGVIDADYENLESFASKKLFQVLVIPKNGRGFDDLRSLRAAKEKDLVTKGISYRIETPMPDYVWPKDSFEVYASTPYRLYQLYSETRQQRFILTGWLEPNGLPNELEQDFIISLRSFLDHQQRLATKNLAPLDTGPIEKVSIPLLIAALFFLALPWAKTYTRPLSNALLGSALASGALYTIGFYLARRLDVTGRGNLVHPGAVGWTAIFLIWASIQYRTIALGAWRKWLVRALSFAALFSLCVLAYEMGHYPPNPRYTTAEDFSFLMYFLGLVYGACLGLTQTRRPVNSPIVGAAAVLLLVLGMSPAAEAQMMATGFDLRQEATRRVDGDVALRESRTERARLDLREKHLLNHFQRIEIDGIVATDRTPARFKKYFDDPQIQPAHNADTNSSAPSSTASEGWLDRWRSKIDSWRRSEANDEADVAELYVDKSGTLSERAKQVLAPLADTDHSVNEVVAHSWGAVMLYNAIQQGYIPTPPNRIIVIGVPDDYIEKWHWLARNTGADVVVVQNINDKAVATVKSSDDEDGGAAKRRTDKSIAEKWRQWSATHTKLKKEGAFLYKPINFPASRATYEGHSRLQYFEYLEYLRIISKTAAELHADQDLRLEQRIAALREEDIQNEIRKIRKQLQGSGHALGCLVENT